MKKAFTIIEFLIIVVIIGILAAALIPRVQNINKAKELDVWNSVICGNTYGKIKKKTNSKIVVEYSNWKEDVYSSFECDKTE